MCPLLFTGDGKPCFIEQNTCDRNVDYVMFVMELV